MMKAMGPAMPLSMIEPGREVMVCDVSGDEVRTSDWRKWDWFHARA